MITFNMWIHIWNEFTYSIVRLFVCSDTCVWILCIRWIHELFCYMNSNICVKSYVSMNLIVTGYTRWIHLYLVYYKWLRLIYESMYVMNSCILLSVYSSVVIHAYEFYEFIEYMNWFVTWIPLFVWSHMGVWIWTRMDLLDEFIYIWCNISDYV